MNCKSIYQHARKWQRRNLVAFNALLNGTVYSAVFVTADSITNKNRKNYWKS